MKILFRNILIVGLLLLGTNQVNALGFGLFRSSYYSSYYYPAYYSSYYYPAYYSSYYYPAYYSSYYYPTYSSFYYPSYYYSSAYYYPTYYTPTVSYYVPSTVYYTPVACETEVPVSVVSSPSTKIYSQPTQAPSRKQTVEPPSKKAPKIRESASFYQQTKLNEISAENNTCQVGFWNISNRDVVLKVGGRTYDLEKNRSLTIDLPREFSWQIGSAGRNQEFVPEDRNSYEIVIRQ